MKVAPKKKSQPPVKHANPALMHALRKGKSEVVVVDVDEPDDDNEKEEGGGKWHLITATSAKAKWWKHYKKINTFKHPAYKHHAMCLICFKACKQKQGVVSVKDGSTGGLKRHLSSHHLEEFEALEITGNSTGTSASTGTSVSLLQFGVTATPKPKTLSIGDRKKVWRVAAASWAIMENVSFRMFDSPTFRQMFVPLNKDALNIVNVDRKGVRQDIMYLGKVAEEATFREISSEGHKISWTSDHWTGPNKETYSTVTGHYIDDNWNLKSNVLDFSVFEGSTSGDRIYADVKRVLNKYNGDSTIVFDVIGITDTTGNMGVLGQHCQANGEEHAYCIDHVCHLNAKLAFARKYCCI